MSFSTLESIEFSALYREQLCPLHTLTHIIHCVRFGSIMAYSLCKLCLSFAGKLHIDSTIHSYSEHFPKSERSNRELAWECRAPTSANIQNDADIVIERYASARVDKMLYQMPFRRTFFVMVTWPMISDGSDGKMSPNVCQRRNTWNETCSKMVRTLSDMFALWHLAMHASKDREYVPVYCIWSTVKQWSIYYIGESFPKRVFTNLREQKKKHAGNKFGGPSVCNNTLCNFQCNIFGLWCVRGWANLAEHMFNMK